MRNFALALSLLFSLVFFSSCGTPLAIKTEIDFIDTVTQTAVKEIEASDDPAVRAEKGYRALKRLAPHTDNLKRWAEGEEPAK